MKKVWVVIGIIVIIIGLCISEQIITYKMTNSMIDKIKMATVSFNEEDYESTKEYLNIVEEQWISDQKYFSVFKQQGGLYEIKSRIVGLQSMIINKAYEDYLIETDKLNNRIYQVYQSDVVNMFNIL